MSTRRTERIAEAIREVVATSVLFELSDPRIRGVTVISAQVSPDLRHATVYVTVMGNETQRKTALRGLQHAAGFLQSRVAARLQTKTTPLLSFKIDEGLAKSAELTRLIEETRAADRRNRGEPEDAHDLTAQPQNPTDVLEADCSAPSPQDDLVSDHEDHVKNPGDPADSIPPVPPLRHPPDPHRRDPD